MNQFVSHTGTQVSESWAKVLKKKKITRHGVSSFIWQVGNSIHQGFFGGVGVQVPFSLWVTAVLSQTCRKYNTKDTATLIWCKTAYFRYRMGVRLNCYSHKATLVNSQN